MKAVIIDDEPHCVGILALQLNEHCPEVIIVAQCSSPENGIEAILKYEPDIVFLDIDMPRMNAFQLLEQFEHIHFKIIFTTAHDKYAIKAFKVGAVDYLLKPIDHEELILAVEKAKNATGAVTHNQLQIANKGFLENIIEKIALPTHEGFQFFDIKDIIYCEASSNYTIVHLNKQDKKVISKTLKEVDEVLKDIGFFRVHKQYSVNLQHIVRYIKGEGGYLILSNGANIPLSRQRRDDFHKTFIKF